MRTVQGEPKELWEEGKEIEYMKQGHYSILLNTIAVCVSVCVRRLMTQLEVARGVRGTAGAEGKTAASKGPDGVVLYELHSRPEHEKFIESAKVHHIFLNLSSSCFLSVLETKLSD